MVEDSRRTLLEKAAVVQRAQREREQDKEKVEAMLPTFQKQVAEVIANHVHPPEQRVVKVTWDYLNIKLYEIKLYERLRPSQFPTDSRTKLSMAVPIGEEEVAVNLSASGYPDPTDEKSFTGLDYQIDIAPLDHILVVKGQTPHLESKKWESEPFTPHTPIGVPLPSGPAWIREATSQDLDEYSELLRAMNEGGTVIGASTPPVVVEDDREFQIEAERRNARLTRNRQKTGREPGSIRSQRKSRRV